MDTTHLGALSMAFLLYAGLSAAYFGWGVAATRIVWGKNLEQFSVTSSIWIGWAFTLFVFQLVHFVLPVNAYVVLPVFAGGVMLTCAHTGTGRHRRAGAAPKVAPAALLGMILVAALLSGWIASRAMLAPAEYDSGLYHFNSIRWINSFAIVPGLGNLHGRLAFNQSFFTYVAALNFFPFFGHGRSVANSFLFLLTTATFAGLLRPILRKPSLLITSHPFEYLSVLFALPVLGFLALSSNGLASPSPDLTSTLLQIVMFVVFANGVGAWVRTHENQESRVVLLVVLAATAVTIKLSNLAFSGMILALVILFELKSSPSGFRRSARLVGITLAILLVWSLRGFVLSGAPLYPSTAGYVDVEWSVPVEKVTDEARWASSWARQPGAHPDVVLASWAWFSPWFANMTENSTAVVFPVAFTLALCSFWLVAMLLKIGRFPPWIEWTVVLPVVGGLAFWFLMAPDLRFANALFFLIPILATLLFLSSIGGSSKKSLMAAAIGISFVVGNLNLVAYGARHAGSLKEISMSGWQAIPDAPLEERVTRSGLIVLTPETGAQCWDAALPCTPYFDEMLMLRDSGDLGSGFKVP